MTNEEFILMHTGIYRDALAQILDAGFEAEVQIDASNQIVRNPTSLGYEVFQRDLTAGDIVFRIRARHPASAMPAHVE